MTKQMVAFCNFATAPNKGETNNDMLVMQAKIGLSLKSGVINELFIKWQQTFCII